MKWGFPVANRLSRLCHAVAAAALIAAAPITSFAAGFWNMPSNLRQFMGYGNGAGYHAPLVLGPITWNEWYRTNEYRVPYAPTPCNGCGCGGYPCSGGQPYSTEPANMPTGHPEVAPAPAAAYHAPNRH